MIKWIIKSINNTSYNEDGHVSFVNEIKFVKEQAPFMIAGAGVVLARGFKWGRKLFKVVQFGVSSITSKEEEKQVPSHKPEEPKKLPPPQNL